MALTFLQPNDRDFDPRLLKGDGYTWLSRGVSTSSKESKDTFDSAPEELWRPLRKIDNVALNRNMTLREEVVGPPTPSFHASEVPISFGRETVDLSSSLTSRFNFWDESGRKVTYANWFYIDRSKGGADLPQPLSVADCHALDVLARRCRESNFGLSTASASGAATPNPPALTAELRDTYCGAKWNAIVAPCDDGASPGATTAASQAGGRFDYFTVKLRKASVIGGLLFSDLTLQWGYGEYRVKGEEDEAALDAAAGHLIFAVHGIGESMWSRKDVTIAPSLIEQINDARSAIQKRQLTDWKSAVKKASGGGKRPPPLPKRIEILPIVWYDKIHTGSDLKMAVQSTTLKTVPGLRSIANDIVFDVLMYMSPDFCYETLACVTARISECYKLFRMQNPSFVGDASIIGHSLGSVIVWDLLANAKRVEGMFDSAFASAVKSSAASAPPPPPSSFSSPTFPWAPTLNVELEPLPFKPKNTFLFGSPLGLFLPLRGASAALATDKHFRLPTDSLFNVFHPSDPVAYRIEPLLLPGPTCPEITPLPTASGPFIDFDGMKDQALKLASDAQNAARDVAAAFKSPMRIMGAIGSWALSNPTATAMSVGGAADLAGGGGGGATLESATSTGSADATVVFALGGKSSRVDYSIQTGILSSESLASLTAHTCYFSDDDVLAFVTRHCTRAI